jgi:hypothetical protein
MKAVRARSAASAWNVGKRVPTSLALPPVVGEWGGEREHVKRQKPGGVEYRCGTR